MFQHLFGKTTINITDTEYIYFSTYLNRIREQEYEYISNYNDHIIQLNQKDKIIIYDKLNREPRMYKMKTLNKYNLKEEQDATMMQGSSNKKNKHNHNMELLDRMERKVIPPYPNRPNTVQPAMKRPPFKPL